MTGIGLREDHSLFACPAAMKLLGAFAFCCATSTLASTAAAAAALALSGALALALSLGGCLALRPLLSHLIWPNFFFALLWLLLPLRLFPLRFEAAALQSALVITLKGNAAIIAILALPCTSGFADNGRALKCLRVPEKLIALILLTYRQLETMRREYGRVFEAASLRGFNPGSNPRTYRTFAWLIGLILARSVDKAERLDKAMRLRGFCGKFPLAAGAAPSRRALRQSRALCALLFACAALALALDFYFTRNNPL